MSTDWITVAAQLANFLVLVWLLKRFLYRPILDGIDAREQEIVARMSEARRLREGAENMQAEHQALINSLRAGREAQMAQTRQDAEAERLALLAETRAQLAQDREEREAQRAEEARHYSAELRRNGAAALLALTRKALADLSDETLEQRIIAHAVAQSLLMSDALKQAAGDSAVAIVTTHDPLPSELRERLRVEFLPLIPDIDLQFHTDSGQSPGLILRLGGAHLSWTVDNYIDGLEALLREGNSRRAKGLTDAA